MKRFLIFTAACCLAPVLRGVPEENEERSRDDRATEKDRKSFAEVDREMNRVWARAISGLDKESLRKLRADQNQWLKYRRDVSTSPLHLGTKLESQKEIEELASHFAALHVLTRQRTEWLEGISEPLPKSGSVEGVWTDSYGGTMELVEERNDFSTSLHFSFEVVRGDTFHLGHISGTASWNGRTGIFTDRTRPNSGGEAVIVFVLRGNQMEVIAEGTSEYHGQKAYFDGDYARVRSIDPERRKKLIRKAEDASAGKEE